MSILFFIIILAVLILVHEFGHFIVAKRAGIRVDEFAIGFPPRIFKKKVGETLYSINAIPVGGYVKIFGENPDEESLHGKDSKRSFVHKSRWIQAKVTGAGIIMNILLAYVLISVGFMVGLPYSADDVKYGARVENAELTVTQVRADSPASEGGLKAGDIIRSVSAGDASLEDPHLEATQEFINTHTEVALTYERAGEILTTTLKPEFDATLERNLVGISMDESGILKLPFYEAFWAGISTTAGATWMTAVGLIDFFKGMFTGTTALDQISGPVGIVGIVGDASALGFAYLLSLTALISINLAIINLLPFPALDGGRLLFIIIEAIRRKPIKPVIANTVNGIGFILLIILMVAVTYSDIMKIITK